MEVTKWEIAARSAALVAVWSILLGAGTGSLLDPPLTAALAMLAAFCLSVASLSWAFEDTIPWKARAADVGGTAVLLVLHGIYWLVYKEEVSNLLKDALPAAAIFLFALGLTSRAIQAPTATATSTSALLGILSIAVGATSWLVTGQWRGLPVSIAVAGLALIGLSLVLEREKAAAIASSRQVQYGSGAVLLVALAGALSVGSYVLADTNNYTWDLTKKRAFTLSDQAKRVVDSVTFDVKVTAFFRATSPGRPQFADLIERFSERNAKITVEWVDPLQDPRRASAAEVTGDHGTVLLEGNDRQRRLEWELTEADLVRELVLLSSNVDHNICWSLGHGEPHPDDEFSEDGLGGMRLQLEGLNYKVSKLEIAKTGIPSACAALVIARPTTPWLPYEMEALAAYLAAGGRALLMLDAGDLPDLAREMERYGVLVGDDVVVDLNLKNQMLGVQDPSFVVLSAEDFGQHPITASLAAAIVLPVARSVRASKEPPEGLVVTDLLRTSPEAWGETEPESGEVKPDEGLEIIGEVPVMAVVQIEDPAQIRVLTEPPPEPAPAEGAEPAMPDPFAELARERSRGVPKDFAPEKGGRLVVIGDSDFAANRFLGWGNNRDLFLNTIAWLVDEENQLGERPEQGEILEISTGAESLLCLVSVFVIPGSALLSALVVFLRRRSL